MNTKLNRRNFLDFTTKTIGLAAAAPIIIPNTVLGNDTTAPPSDRVTMGFIGMGVMGNGHLFGEAWTYLPEGYAGRDDVQVLALCDVWRNKREQAQNRLHQYYEKKYGKNNSRTCDAYHDFRELLERNDIDAVLIATPIHWHAVMTAMAAEAGKDIYCEKPTAVSIHESQAMKKAVQKNKCVFQAGTQQRSEYGGKFRRACELIRNGRIGKVETIYAFRNGGGAKWPEKFGEEKPIPEGFDWDLWLGPAPKIPYQGKSDAHLFGFGGINWGQHHYDIVQWCLDADHSGPIEIWFEEDYAVYQYKNGTIVRGCPLDDSNIGSTGGGWYLGSTGRIGVDREHLVSEPESLLEKPLSEDAERVYHSNSHSINFLECVKSRKKTICDIETAHRSISVVLLGGIATRLQRKLLWDPQNEVFISDEEANQLLNLPHRDPWKI